MTQEQLAAAAGVSLKTIGNLENEGVTPQKGTLRKVREALGLSSDLSVAAATVDAVSPLGKALGIVPSRPAPRTGADRYLDDMLARIEDLEDRVSGLEAVIRRITGSGKMMGVAQALAAHPEEGRISEGYDQPGGDEPA